MLVFDDDDGDNDGDYVLDRLAGLYGKEKKTKGKVEMDSIYRKDTRRGKKIAPVPRRTCLMSFSLSPHSKGLTYKVCVCVCVLYIFP